MFGSSVGEPSKTILRDSWRAARMRAAGLDDDERALFCSLLDSVESAWPHVRTIQHLHDQFHPSALGYRDWTEALVEALPVLHG